MEERCKETKQSLLGMVEAASPSSMRDESGSPVAGDSEEAEAPGGGTCENNLRDVTKTLKSPVSIVRILEVIFTCISFSPVASLGNSTIPQWRLCMFRWCCSFCVTLLILFLEITKLSTKWRHSWDDFTTASAVLAALIVLGASIDYHNSFVYPENIKGIGATVTSCLACILYFIEFGLNIKTHGRSGWIRGFLSLAPYFLKFMELFGACIIFIYLDNIHFSEFPGLQWCVAVYSICFIFTVIVIVLTICHIQSLFPALFDKVLAVCNVLAVLMYITAVVIWPLYSLQNKAWPSDCTFKNSFKVECTKLGVFCMTLGNLLFYTVETIGSFKILFCNRVFTKSSGNL